MAGSKIQLKVIQAEIERYGIMCRQEAVEDFVKRLNRKSSKKTDKG